MPALSMSARTVGSWQPGPMVPMIFVPVKVALSSLLERQSLRSQFLRNVACRRNDVDDDAMERMINVR